MLPTRWSHLVRHGLIGTSLLGLASASAAAAPCDDLAESTVAVVVGLEISPKPRLIGGVEARRCLSDETEAMLRLQLGGGARVVAGVRARPLEDSGANDEREHLGFEAGGILDFRGKLGMHLAVTYGHHSAYLAVQGQMPISEPEQPARWSLLGGLAPWTLSQGAVVEGRPIIVNGRLLRPALVGGPRVARSAEERAVRDHFLDQAQIEYSSVWAFLRLAEELAAVGAPVELIARALDAADDEVRHAELCARAAGGGALAPLPPAVARPRFAGRSAEALALLAAEAWCEGCLNEGAAAEEARLASAEAEGTARGMLATIARDEAGHAELSWAVLSWVFSVAPDVAATAIGELPPPAAPVAPSVDPALARHGIARGPIVAAARAEAEAQARTRLAALAA